MDETCAFLGGLSEHLHCRSENNHVVRSGPHVTVTIVNRVVSVGDYVVVSVGRILLLLRVANLNFDSASVAPTVDLVT